MANKTRLRIVTPQKESYTGDIEMLVVRTMEGDIGIMAGHAPLTSVLKYGVAKIVVEDENFKKMVIFGGFIEVQPTTITILTDTAEYPEDIDQARANQAKERAERRLKERNDKIDTERAEAALKRALLRIEATNK